MAESAFYAGDIEGQINELSGQIGTVPSGQTVEGQITTLNTALMGTIQWSDWTKITTYTAGQAWDESYYMKKGKITYLMISVKGLAANTNTKIFQIPKYYRPIRSIDFAGFGGAAYLNMAHFKVQANGDVYVYSADTYAQGYISYPTIWES